MDDTKRSLAEVVVQERPAGDLQKVRRTKNMRANYKVAQRLVYVANRRQSKRDGIDHHS